MAEADEGRTMSALARLANQYRREFSARIRHEEWALEAGMRPPAYGILQVVRARQPISQRAVSDRIGIDPADIVAIIDMLEDAGFVTRSRDEEDGRVRNLSLTPEGAARTARLDQIAAEVADVVLASLSRRERAVLDRLLFKAAFEERAS
jgi:DNA-binding MarR family transcriptional regulator